MNKKLTIVRGLPGSGKSTLTRQIYSDSVDQSLNPVILSTDDIFTSCGYYLYDADVSRYAHLVNQAKCNQACIAGIKHIIIDNTNINLSQISPYVDMAIKYHYDIEVIEPKNDWSKNVKECFKRTTHNVPLEIIQRMSDSWEDTESVLRKIRKEELLHF